MNFDDYVLEQFQAFLQLMKQNRPHDRSSKDYIYVYMIEQLEFLCNYFKEHVVDKETEF